MSIYIAFHKESPVLTDDKIYTPLHVGKALSDKELSILTDDTGEHISEKNRTFSELTGLYWIWKNTNSEFVGLSHYRRFFFAKSPSLKMSLKKWGEFIINQRNKRFGVYYTSNIHSKRLILTGEEIQSLLSDYEVVVPIKRKLKYSVYEQYKKRHHIKDLDVTKQIVIEKYPEYTNAFDKSMAQKEVMHCNMFVMKRTYFNAYMEWLFDILFELEKRTDVSGYDNYQKRLYGFISERLLDVWLIHNKLKTKSLPVIYFKKLKV